jgi:hypothetical protein
MAALGIRCEKTLKSWRKGCPFLDGEPLTYRKESVPISHNGRYVGTQRVNTWDPADVRRVRAKQQEVKAGRWVDKHGRAWLSRAQSHARLRRVKKGFGHGTLLKWELRRKVKFKCPGFPEAPKARWFLEADIDRECEALRISAHNGTRLRLRQVMAALGIRAENTLYAWLEGCPYLDGEPLSYRKEGVPISYNGRFSGSGRGYVGAQRVNTWDSAEVRRVRAMQQEVKAGRWVDKQGRAWLSQSRSLVRLRRVKKGFGHGTLIVWARRGKVTSKCPGFPEAPKALWFLEADIDRECEALRESLAGRRVVNGEPCLTLRAAAEYCKVSRQTILKWEKFCPYHPPDQRLKPVFGRAEPLKLSKRKKHRGKGKKGTPSAQGLQRLYPVADLDVINARRGAEDFFDGEYPDPKGRRFSLHRAALETGGRFSYATLLRYVTKAKYHPKPRLPVKLMKRPAPPWQEEYTVSDKDLDLLCAGLDQAMRQGPPGVRADAEEIGDRLGLDRGERIKLGSLLPIFRKRAPASAAQEVRKVKNKARHKKVWHYDFAEFRRWLGGQTVAAVCKDLLGRADAPEAACRGKGGGSGPPKAGAAGAKYPGHVKKPYRTGRTPDPEREAILEYAYDHYITKGLSRKQVWEGLRRRFGNSEHLPSERDDVKVLAKEWSGRFSPPLPLKRPDK